MKQVLFYMGMRGLCFIRLFCIQSPTRINNKNIRMKRTRKKRSKECEQRKSDIDNKECVKAYDEYACNNNKSR